MTTGILFALKIANIKSPKAFLDVMEVMKLALGICGGVLVKEYRPTTEWLPYDLA